ncbi:14311_t:CDS:2 [Funneliformis caledonium]|uniref:14311_t:CDS:1 n=1 Tax=Funneliformis caledonium TaxID=1117310 RepID=A0A9N9E697_9GLOM|nr:14311_t:CDS:2 [Funneliformis caledonium]
MHLPPIQELGVFEDSPPLYRQNLAKNTTGTKPLLVRYLISDSGITDLMPMVGGYAITNHTGIGRLQSK